MADKIVKLPWIKRLTTGDSTTTFRFKNNGEDVVLTLIVPQIAADDFTTYHQSTYGTVTDDKLYQVKFIPVGEDPNK